MNMRMKTTRVALIALVLVALAIPFATANARNASDKKGHAKPTVVLLHADWCGACKKIAPMLTELKQQYGDRLNFVELDVTNEETTAQAAVKARELGIGKFFEANKKKSSLVALIGKGGKVLFQTHYSTNRQGAFDRATYVQAFDRVLAKG